MAIISVNKTVFRAIDIFINEVLFDDEVVEEYSEDHVKATIKLIDRLIKWLQSHKLECNRMLDYIYERNKK